MAIVVYECNTCKRQIELNRNTRGLEVINRCVITQGCKGELFQSQLFQDYVLGKPLQIVEGIENWQSRKLIFNYTQVIQSNKWIIVHGLNSIPTYNIYVNKPIETNQNNYTLIEPDKFEIVDENTVIIHFDKSYSGYVQLISNTTQPSKTSSTKIEQISDVQISTKGELAIAIKGMNSGNICVKGKFIDSQQHITEFTKIVDTIPSILTPWNNVSKISINGVSYHVRSFNMSDFSTFIPNGAKFIITDIDPTGTYNSFESITKMQFIFLLSNEPYQRFDTNVNQYVDNFNSNMYISLGEIYTIDSVISTFPPIQQYL